MLPCSIMLQACSDLPVPEGSFATLLGIMLKFSPIVIPLAAADAQSTGKPAAAVAIGSGTAGQGETVTTNCSVCVLTLCTALH